MIESARQYLNSVLRLYYSPLTSGMLRTKDVPGSQKGTPYPNQVRSNYNPVTFLAYLRTQVVYLERPGNLFYWPLVIVNKLASEIVPVF